MSHSAVLGYMFLYKYEHTYCGLFLISPMHSPRSAPNAH